MSVKPILFSTAMVQKILSGDKTQTRRIMKPQLKFAQMHTHKGKTLYDGEECIWGWKQFTARDNWVEFDEFSRLIIPHAPYRVGDILWVRETWAYISDWTCVDESVGMPDGYIYRADWQNDEHPKWKPSIFMPKEAARIFLRITDVRAERLQGITEEDAKAEGVCPDGWILTVGKKGYGIPPSTYVNGFANIWEDINGKKSGYTWCDNPFVWIYQFEKTNYPW